MLPSPAYSKTASTKPQCDGTYPSATLQNITGCMAAGAMMPNPAYSKPNRMMHAVPPAAAASWESQQQQQLTVLLLVRHWWVGHDVISRSVLSCCVRGKAALCAQRCAGDGLGVGPAEQDVAHVGAPHAKVVGRLAHVVLHGYRQQQVGSGSLAAAEKQQCITRECGGIV